MNRRPNGVKRRFHDAASNVTSADPNLSRSRQKTRSSISQERRRSSCTERFTGIRKIRLPWVLRDPVAFVTRFPSPGRRQ